ncbi:circadian clock KaiB family protein [Streptomyces chrestomyceticus]|uniref:circadian clock KaiB family protein n=1 Tax=Streptomyces chrestomyceticus TaxID=68185 RepID=UPI00340AC692
MTVVDAVERPQLAERSRVLATPAVVRLRPVPQRGAETDWSPLRQCSRTTWRTPCPTAVHRSR